MMHTISLKVSLKNILGKLFSGLLVWTTHFRTHHLKQINSVASSTMLHQGEYQCARQYLNLVGGKGLEKREQPRMQLVISGLSQFSVVILGSVQGPQLHFCNASLGNFSASLLLTCIYAAFISFPILENQLANQSSWSSWKQYSWTQFFSRVSNSE